jgi:hypothetical protein
MRESSSGCKDDADTPVRSTQPGKQRQKKKHILASIRAGNSTKKKRKAWYAPPARADILLSRSVMACSRWMCSLFASERAFSVFFALANADLVDFSAVALATVVASKAFLEASSSACRDEIQALAATKASAIQKGKRKSNKVAKKGTQDKQSIGKKITLGSLSSFQILDTFSAQSDKLLHQDLSRKIT